MTKTKKIILMSSLVVILAVTAVLNFVLTTNPSAPTAGNSASADYFTSYRTERMTKRNQELLQLDSIIATVSTDSQEYKNAINMKLKIVDIMEKELVLESLIKAKDFTTDAVVSISQTSDNVNVFVKADTLQYNDFHKIYNILQDEAGIPAANITIMPIRN